MTNGEISNFKEPEKWTFSEGPSEQFRLRNRETGCVPDFIATCFPFSLRLLSPSRSLPTHFQVMPITTICATCLKSNCKTVYHLPWQKQWSRQNCLEHKRTLEPQCLFHQITWSQQNSLISANSIRPWMYFKVVVVAVYVGTETQKQGERE